MGATQDGGFIGVPLKIFNLLLLLLTSCSYLTVEQEQAETLEPLNPYFFHVIDEIFDGKTLFVQAELEAKKEQELPLAIIVLQGFSQGQLIREKFFEAEKFIFENKDIFTLSLDAEGLSNYQVHFYWGQHARNYLASKYKEVINDLLVQKVNVQKIRACKEKCRIKYKLKIDVLNQSLIILPEIAFNVELFDVAGEVYYMDRIHFSSTLLSPGESYSFSMLLVEPEALSEFDLKVRVSVAASLD